MYIPHIAVPAVGAEIYVGETRIFRAVIEKIWAKIDILGVRRSCVGKI